MSSPRWRHVVVLALLITLTAVEHRIVAQASITAEEKEMMTAIRRGQADQVRKMLKDGVEPTPPILSTAVSQSNVEITKILLKAGADPNAGWSLAEGVVMTPLGTAATNGNVAIVTLLLEAGAQPDTPHMGRSPLSWATERKHDDVITLLEKHGARGGTGVIEKMMGGPMVTAIRKGDAKTVKKLLKQGSDPNAFGDDGLAPIHHAARSGNGEIVALLLDAGADPDARTRKGHQHAAELAGGQDAVMKELEKKSRELKKRGRAPLPEKDAAYTPGTVLGGPCQHTGAIPQNAGCGASGTEVFKGTSVRTNGWSGAVSPPLCEPVELPPLPGTYTVTVIESTTEWVGDKCYPNIGKVYFSKDSKSRTVTFEFEVKKGPPKNPCDEIDDPWKNRIESEARAYRDALEQNLSTRASLGKELAALREQAKQGGITGRQARSRLAAIEGGLDDIQEDCERIAEAVADDQCEEITDCGRDIAKAMVAGPGTFCAAVHEVIAEFRGGANSSQQAYAWLVRDVPCLSELYDRDDFIDFVEALAASRDPLTGFDWTKPRDPTLPPLR